jgi:mono/diheme cytochrome c family protein
MRLAAAVSRGVGPDDRRRLVMPDRRERLLSRAALITTALGALAAPAATASERPAKVVVESWVRPPGDAAALEAGTFPRLKIELGSLALTEGRRFDAQYGKYGWYRGVSLSTLLARLHPPSAVDLALLRFANGMVVPIPLRDQRVLDQLDPFIALEMRPGPEAPYTTAFAPLTRKVGAYADAPVTKFVGNKVVVARMWHPAVAEKAQSAFSPWAFVDTLVAVELVAAAPYYAQFEVGGTPAARAGAALFQQSCQFCHGARKVGAQFGWDFVEPAPLYTYRKGEKRLYYHVRYRRFDAAARGQNMPALEFMTQEDAGNLWQWLEAIGTRPMPAYAPAQ